MYHIMKRLCFIIFTVSSLCANAQKVSMVNPLENFFYLGIPNNITFAVEGYKSKDLLITTDNGTINTLYPPSVYMFPERKGVIHFDIYKNDAEKTKVGSYISEARSLPEPVPYCAGKIGGDVQISTFRVQSGITATIVGTDLEARVAIIYYTITIVSKDNVKVFTKKCKGSQHPPDVVDAINKLKINDRIVFTDIICKTGGNNNSGSIYKLRPMIFRVIE